MAEFSQLIVFAGLVILAMFTGTIAERRHYASIIARENKFKNLPAIPNAEFEVEQPVRETRMVCGSVVVSIDFFKKFLGDIRTIFGGRMSSYESVMDRGRREAVLRMKEEFPDADIIVNMRLETSNLSDSSANSKGQLLCVEMLAYGTAIKYDS